MTHKSRVSPFGYPWIKACSRLPMAFRSVPRPSSPLDAKASAKRPSLRFNFALGSTSCNDSAEILQVRLEPIRRQNSNNDPSYILNTLPSFEDCPNITARTHFQTTSAFYYSSIELVRRQVFSYMHYTSGLSAQYEQNQLRSSTVSCDILPKGKTSILR